MLRQNPRKPINFNNLRDVSLNVRLRLTESTIQSKHFHKYIFASDNLACKEKSGIRALFTVCEGIDGIDDLG